MFICIHSRSLQEKDVFKSHAKLLFLREMWGCHVSLSTFPSFFIRSSADFPPTTKRAKKSFLHFPVFPSESCVGRKNQPKCTHTYFPQCMKRKTGEERGKRAPLGEREKWQIAFSAKGEKKPQKREFRMKEGEKMNKNKNKKNQVFFQSKFWISKRHTQINYFWLFEQKGQQGHSSKIV